MTAFIDLWIGFSRGCLVVGAGVLGLAWSDWATASPQPAGHASHGACFASPPFGDHQAQGCGQ